MKITKIMYVGAIATTLLITSQVFAQSPIFVASQFTQNLGIGSSGSSVSILQTFLEQNGFLTLPAGTNPGYFGNITAQALIKYQQANGISPASGYFGPLSRAFLTKALSGGSSTVSPAHPITPTTSTPTLTNIFPISQAIGSTVTVTGTGFTATGNNIDFGLFRVGTNLSSTDGKTLTFTVPHYGGADCAANVACPQWAVAIATGNSYQFTVKNPNGQSNALTFTIVAATAATSTPACPPGYTCAPKQPVAIPLPTY